MKTSSNKITVYEYFDIRGYSVLYDPSKVLCFFFFVVFFFFYKGQETPLMTVGRLATTARPHVTSAQPESMPRQALCCSPRRDKYHYSSQISLCYPLKLIMVAMCREIHLLLMLHPSHLFV